MRGGPGLGGILPAQSDYFQAVKGGGHGDYRTLVLAPSSIQEAVDLTMLCFYLAQKYRNPTMMIGDGMIGQMMEAVEFPDDYEEPPLPSSDEWAATGAEDRKARIIKSLFLDPVGLENNVLKLEGKYQQMFREEIRFERYKVSAKNKLLIVAYGTMARICQTAIDELEEEGVSVGLFRPITLFPFPEKELYAEATKQNIKKLLTIEMSMPQMYEDVVRSLYGKRQVEFFGRTGGIVPTPVDVKDQVHKLLGPKRSAAKKTKRKKA
jgi:2-oxoglutarate ferredoxin oxidoreductase subunit alpha